MGGLRANYPAIVVSTHALTFSGPVLTKRYRSWDRGEHRREWLMLQHIHRHAPELVPQPVSADLQASAPSITMTVLPGVPLKGTVSARQLDALVVAIKQLWAVPREGLPAACSWRSSLPFARRLTDGPRPAEPVTAAAYDAAVAWWDGPDPALLQTPPSVSVLGHGDANLANYLWDGHRIRIVDFEDAAISDPATELAILVEHLSARHLDADGFCTRFDVDRVRLRAGRRLWAMFWLRLLLPGGPAEARNPSGTADTQARRLLDLLSAS
jgi:aminoglycoside phosphotransferase (APT) family kinase protein